MDKLKAMCEQVIWSRITLETATETLILAEHNGAEQLKRKSMKFLHIHASRVVDTIKWKQLTVNYPHLVTEAGRKLYL